MGYYDVPAYQQRQAIVSYTTYSEEYSFHHKVSATSYYSNVSERLMARMPHMAYHHK